MISKALSRFRGKEIDFARSHPVPRGMSPKRMPGFNGSSPSIYPLITSLNVPSPPTHITVCDPESIAARVNTVAWPGPLVTKVLHGPSLSMTLALIFFHCFPVDPFAELGFTMKLIFLKAKVKPLIVP
jgi:hypothetical protein